MLQKLKIKHKKLYNKVTTGGIIVYRGIRPKYEKVFASDPGDFGRGVYWTTSKARAKSYSSNIITARIVFNNPLILTVNEAYDLADHYNTINEIDIDKRIKNAEIFTRDMLSFGFDGLISIRLTRKHKYKEMSFHSELEIVDYRSYMKI